MATYLLSKEEFITLYKFGSLHIRTGASAGGLDLRTDVEELISRSDVFEYAQERLFITASGDPAEVLKMKQVTGIYPLDAVSKRLFESEFNRKIVFGEPICEGEIRLLLSEHTGREKAVRGIRALFEIFGIKEEPEQDIVEEVLKGIAFRKRCKYYDIPLEERTPWSMLIAYDRYRNYPNKGGTGYFYDMVDAFMYGNYKRPDLVGFNEDIIGELCSQVFKELDKLRGKGIREVAEKLSNRKDIRINAAITEVFGSPILPALFFYAKDEIKKEGEVLTLHSLNVLKKIGDVYPDQFPHLLTLVGGFFGFTWVYDRYYEALGLPFMRNASLVRDVLDAKPTKEQVHGPAPETPPVEDKPMAGESGDEDVSQPVPESFPEASEVPEVDMEIVPEEKQEEVTKDEPATTDESEEESLIVENDKAGPQEAPSKDDPESEPEPAGTEEEREDGEEYHVDVFGNRQSFSEFAMDVYLKSLGRVKSDRELRVNRFQEFLERSSARQELLDIVKSGEDVMLNSLRKRMDSKFSDNQWKQFKSEIMIFNKS